MLPPLGSRSFTAAAIVRGYGHSVKARPSVLRAGTRSPALHRGPSLLAGEPAAAGARRRRRLDAAAGRRQRGPDEGRHLGPRVVEVPRLAARRLTRHDEPPG